MKTGGGSTSKLIKRIVWIIVCIVLIFVSITYVYHSVSESRYLPVEPRRKTMEIVVSRYNETLEWTKEYPYNQYRYIVYNKGDNDVFEKSRVDRVIRLPNVGREHHTYFHHIVENYGRMAEIVVFFPGSLEDPYKRRISRDMLENIERYNNAYVILYNVPYLNWIHYNYKQEVYVSSNDANVMTSSNRVQPSDVRPFGEWYKHYIGRGDVHYQTMRGLFCASRADIEQHPRSYYEGFKRMLGVGSNPETGFYCEFAMESIIGPLRHTNREVRPGWMVLTALTPRLLYRNMGKRSFPRTPSF